MVMSGNSSCRRFRTSPMDRCERSVATGTTEQEHQLELADLQLVAVDKGGLVDALPIEVGAVERTDVPDLEPVGAGQDLDVAARDGDVVEEDVALGMAAGR